MSQSESDDPVQINLALIFLKRKESFILDFNVSFISMSIGPCVVKKILICDGMRICQVLSNGK